MLPPQPATWANLSKSWPPPIGAVLVISLVFGIARRSLLRVVVYAAIAASAFLISEHVAKPLVQRSYYEDSPSRPEAITAASSTSLAMWLAFYPMIGRRHASSRSWPVAPGLCRRRSPWLACSGTPHSTSSARCCCPSGWSLEELPSSSARRVNITVREWFARTLGEGGNARGGCSAVTCARDTGVSRAVSPHRPVELDTSLDTERSSPPRSLL